MAADLPDIPGLPIVGDASQALLGANPTLGAIIIFLSAALVAMAWTWRADLKAKDKKIEELSEKLVQAYKEVIPVTEHVSGTMADLMVFFQGGGGAASRKRGGG